MFKTRLPPLPEPSRLDSLLSGDLQALLETSLGETFHLMDDQEDWAKSLALMERHLETALMVCRSLRRRV